MFSFFRSGNTETESEQQAFVSVESHCTRRRNKMKHSDGKNGNSHKNLIVLTHQVKITTQDLCYSLHLSLVLMLGLMLL